MNAKKLEDLVTTIGMCETSLGYIVVFKTFLETMGHDTNMYGLNKIVYETFRELNKHLDIDEVTIDGKIYNISNPIYNTDLVYDMSEYGFKINLIEPPFDIDDVVQNNSFLNGIKNIEFEDGTIMLVSDLNTNEVDGGMSELDTFFNFFDINKYNEIVELLNNKCWITVDHKGEMEMSDEYILIINQLIIKFLS